MDKKAIFDKYGFLIVMVVSVAVFGIFLGTKDIIKYNETKKIVEQESKENKGKKVIQNDTGEIQIVTDESGENQTEVVTEEKQHRDFVTVDESYLDGALFIGDSRTQTISLYANWDKTVFYAEQGVSVWKILDEKIVKSGNKKITVKKALDKNKFEKIIAKEANTDTDSIVSADLFLYNREKGTVWGADNEFISVPRLDDVMCAYSCINALIKSKETNKESVNVCAVFDNEEVGSTTKQGADSSFLTDVLSRISMCKGKDNEDFIRACASSFMLSADNAHAVHPNYKEKADPTNRPYMNKGIVIKYNANQKYTTDAVSAAIFKEICKKAEVPVQSYVNRSDIPGGSTLGNISNSHVSLNTVDIGLAQLAMHSPYETAGIKDTELMIKAVKKFYETAIITGDNGEFTCCFICKNSSNSSTQ